MTGVTLPQRGKGPRDDGLCIKQVFLLSLSIILCTSQRILIRNPDKLTDLWAFEGELTLKTEGFDAQVILAIPSRVG
jgi:hypothetical protein